MAEKRMFSKSIVMSDAFLDMPASARSLYYTLGMCADDDGFVGAPKSIVRQCGAAEDDLKLLIVKRFVLAFDSGVIVIKHWKINNTLKSDRYRPTEYQDEFAQLTVKPNKAYTEKRLLAPKQDEIPDTEPPRNQPGTNPEPEWNQPGTRVEPQNSIGKDLVEGRLEEDSNYISPPTPARACAREESDAESVKAAVDFYEENISMAPTSTVVTREIVRAVGAFGPEIVIHAMKQAALAESKDWRYVDAVLKRYEGSGFKTIEDVQNEEKRHKAKKEAVKKGQRPYGGDNGGWDDEAAMEQIERLSKKMRGRDHSGRDDTKAVEQIKRLRQKMNGEGTG